MHHAANTMTTGPAGNETAPDDGRPDAQPSRPETPPKMPPVWSPDRPPTPTSPDVLEPDPDAVLTAAPPIAPAEWDAATRCGQCKEACVVTRIRWVS